MIATSKLNWVADSAGTGSWHSGQDMDRRAKTSLLKAGYSPSTHAAKQFRTEFFYDRDLIIALDMEHYEVFNFSGQTPKQRQSND
ncbi:low molecular weight protein tyrosine phosphatase [mine drainage metagenome]|uniref:protein-tyrosine-phosphatase n=1 Tax=mine drainage metagenome TaxID=410659 RepID=T1DAJ7_9ZZZZ